MGVKNWFEKIYLESYHRVVLAQFIFLGVSDTKLGYETGNFAAPNVAFAAPNVAMTSESLLSLLTMPCFYLEPVTY